MDDLHERISSVLLGTGKSNDELAQILGVNKNTISAYKNKHGDLKGIVLEGIVKHFDINPVWLLTGSGTRILNEPYMIQSLDKVTLKAIIMAIDEIIEEECLIISSETKADLILSYYEGFRRDIEERKKQGTYVELSEYTDKKKIRNSFYILLEAVQR
mgnify:FL=1